MELGSESESGRGVEDAEYKGMPEGTQRKSGEGPETRWMDALADGTLVRTGYNRRRAHTTFERVARA
jgi:hypothetical protein